MWTQADFEGKILIVEQWAAWCGPCIDNFPRVERLYKLIQRDPSIALVSFNLDDDIGQIGDFMSEFKKEYSFPVLFARSNTKILSLPRTWIVDGQGFIREDLVGAGDKYVESVLDAVNTVRNAPPIANLPAGVIRKQLERNARDGVRSR